jgi:flagellar basal-body rod protein FlgB
MKAISDAMSQLLARSLDRRFERQELISGNVANVDTPGYQPVDLAFEGAIQGAMDTSAQDVHRTHNAHLAGTGQRMSAAEEVVLRPDVTDAMDGNGVDLDKESARLADNAARFRVTAEVARRRYALINQVLTQAGGR